MSTRAQRLTEKLNTSKADQDRLFFPLDIDTEGRGNIMRISINVPSGSKYLANGTYKKAVDPQTGNELSSNFRTQNNRSNIAGALSRNYRRITTYIDLFMPPEVQASYLADWGSDNLGLVGAGLNAGSAIAGIRSFEDAGELWNQVKNTASESLLRTAAQTAQALTPLNFESLRRTVTSTVANPYMEVVFNGVSNRTFSFTFKMIPKNEKEQLMVKRIIEELKFHRSPELKYENQNNYWLFPSEFDLQFIHKDRENPWLFKISTCALTNFSVNYTPDGQYAGHADGSPFSTSITMEFTEMEALTKERVREGY